MLKRLKLKGIISNFSLDMDEEQKGFFKAEFNLIREFEDTLNISVFPSLELIPDFILPDWIKNNESREIEIKVYKRWDKYYTYESQLWKAIRNVI